MQPLGCAFGGADVTSQLSDVGPEGVGTGDVDEGALGGEVSGEEFTLRLSPDTSATAIQVSGNSQPKQLTSARAAFQSRHDIVGLGRSLLFERLSQASPSRPCP